MNVQQVLLFPESSFQPPITPFKNIYKSSSQFKDAILKDMLKGIRHQLVLSKTKLSVLHHQIKIEDWHK